MKRNICIVIIFANTKRMCNFLDPNQNISLIGKNFFLLILSLEKPPKYFLFYKSKEHVCVFVYLFMILFNSRSFYFFNLWCGGGMGEKVSFYQFNVAWSILLTLLHKLYTVHTRDLWLMFTRRCITFSG